jgi:Protein of Unknown function (DUF2784)
LRDSRVGAMLVKQATMVYRLLADAVLLAHAAFVAFVVFGGLAVLRWPRLAFAHLPAAGWGVLVEYMGWICPLTPLEDRLREAGGEVASHGDFVIRYLVPVLYPADLTRGLQLLLGSVALALNLVVYWRLARRRRSQPVA